MAVLAVSDLNETKKVNINVEKTEAEWSKAMDNFFLYATPIWFEWLKWIIIIGAIHVVASRTHDTLLQLIYDTSLWFFMLYMMGFFYSFEFHGFPLIKNDRARRIVSLIISGILAIGVSQALINLSQKLQI